MSLRELDIKSEYRNKHGDIVTKFYNPLFCQGNKYCRSVGFFSSSSLARYADGLKKLVDNGGIIQMVASPKLSNEDVEAIEKGYELRNKIIEDAMIREMKDPVTEFEKENLNLLANYIALGILEFKIAVIPGKGSIGIYHEKLGLIYDKEGEYVAFTGSANESEMAMDHNYETIDVYCSWKEKDSEHIDNKVKAFERIWNNDDSEVEVIEFPKVKREFLERYKYSPQILDTSDISVEEDNFLIKKMEVGIPPNVKLYDYQIEAIDSWEKEGYQGIFDMATGTGKTFTGIAALCRLLEKNDGRLASIIVCPQQHLVEQWVEDLNKFGIYPIIGYSSTKYKNYDSELRRAVFDYNLGVKKFICFICTNSSFVLERVQKKLQKIRDNRLLIVDEAHNMGAENTSQFLDEAYEYRLALSATLERHRDEMGTTKLLNYFGKKCIEYSLERAIQEKKLTRYYYYPIPVYFSEEELERYTNISKELFKYIQVDKKGNSKLSKQGEKLAIKRARIAAGAISKVDALMEQIKPYVENHNILVYCGATSVEGEDETENIRQIDLITKKLGLELGMKVAQFTSKENMNERLILRKEFAAGDSLQALIAIKCLDEGVNIPSIETAFILASTTNPKEYIQRRGRVLRLYPGKTFAYIYDFVILPRELSSVIYLSEDELRYDRSLVKNELERIKEFKRLAENSYDSNDLILNIEDAYGLYDEEDEEC